MRLTDPNRRRRLDEVFGELPQQTSDDRDDQPSPRDRERDDAWLREQVPPHHGD